MTERIHVDTLLVDLPFRLNPVLIAHQLSPRSPASIGRFLTAVAIRYHPRVAASTPGTTTIGVSINETPPERLRACSPLLVTPCWKGGQIHVSRESLCQQNMVHERNPKSLQQLGLWCRL